MNWEIPIELRQVLNFKIMKYILFLIPMIIFSCSPEGENKLPPPAAVEMVVKTTDLGFIERGIDAVPGSDAIYIEWYLLKDENVISYSIHRKNKDNDLSFSKIETINVENNITPFDTTFSFIDINNVDVNTEYYYYVTATNKDGIEGADPDSLTENHYMLLSRVVTYDILDTVFVNNLPVLSWSYQSDLQTYYYIVRIEELISGRLVWVQQFERPAFHTFEELDLGDQVLVPNPPVLERSVWYQWRIDKVGPDALYSGSESDWKSFVVY